MSDAAAERARLFVALRVGGAALAALAREARHLTEADPALRPAALGHLHLTLAFLGPTARDRVPAIAAALAAVAPRHAPVDVRYAGLGAFPDAERARVLWAGVRESRPGALARLAAEVGAALAELGFASEKRTFSAHVTLARVRAGRRPSPATLARLAAAAAQDFGVDRLSDLLLIVSLAGNGTYTYNDLTRHPLQGPP